MEHHFDIDLATEYGVFESVLINHFQFWIKKNVANEMHFHDGHYWTYNTLKGLHELFPYVTSEQVRRALERLVDKNVLMKGNYNTTAMNRTLWFSFVDEEKFLNCQMHLALTPNGFDTDAKSLHIKETYNNITTTTYTHACENSKLRNDVANWLFDNQEGLTMTLRSAGLISEMKSEEELHKLADPIIENFCNWLIEVGEDDSNRLGRKDAKSKFRNWLKREYNGKETTNTGAGAASIPEISQSLKQRLLSRTTIDK